MIKLHTWHVELLVAATALVAVAVVSEKGYVEWIGSLAVLLSFAHMQVADRLAERAAYDESTSKTSVVECFRWAVRYLIGKEICWLIYFVALGAWSALVGVALFLLYPLWRHWYRRRWPVEDSRARLEQATSTD